MHLKLSHRLRRVLVRLLVVLIPVQGLSAGVASALGPSHTHAGAASSGLELDDVRRAPVAARGDVHVATAFGHFHGGAAARHYHPRSDASVVLDDAGLLQQAADDDLSSFHASSLLFAALLPHVPAHAPVVSRCVVAAVDERPSSTRDPSPPERPPRRG